MRPLVRGEPTEPSLTGMAQVIAAARSRNKGYFEYLAELEDARRRFGDEAADFQLTLDLEFARESAEAVREKRRV